MVSRRLTRRVIRRMISSFQADGIWSKRSAGVERNLMRRARSDMSSGVGVSLDEVLVMFGICKVGVSAREGLE